MLCALIPNLGMNEHELTMPWCGSGDSQVLINFFAGAGTDHRGRKYY